MRGRIVTRMSVVDLIPLAWLAVAALVVAVCQVASRADAGSGLAGRMESDRGELLR